MKHLQILNAVLLAVGAAIGLVLGVVCLIYTVYLDSAPRLRAEMPLLLAFTAAFATLMLAAALAFFGHRRRWHARWLLQCLPVLPLAAIILILVNLKN
jgi:Ca2+/Na+ antiporter